MSQYEMVRLRRIKGDEDFMRSLGIEMSASVSKRTTAENRRRRRTRVGSSGRVLRRARWGGQLGRSQLSRAMQNMRICLVRKGEVFKAVWEYGRGEDGWWWWG